LEALGFLHTGIFAKTMPVVAISEIKGVIPGSQPTILHKDEDRIDYETVF
jgi:hypothetical protein